MRHCKACDLDIKEDTIICPLCSRGLVDIEGKEENHSSYPIIEFDHQAFRLIQNILVFLAIVLSALLVFIDWYSKPGISWSVIPTGIIIYFIITLKYSIQHTTSGGLKILVQAISAIVIVFIIDVVDGTVGWSINFGIPSIVIVANVALVALMLVNLSNWETYIFYELAFLIFGVILVALCIFHIIQYSLFSYIALGLSVTILVATFVFGDRKAKLELAKRFHI